MALTEFGKKVKIALVERGLTQRKLAEILGVSLQHLNGVLHGYSALELEERVWDWLLEEKTSTQKEGN